MNSVNNIQKSMDACRRQLAYHEAGHWIVAKLLGFVVGDIALTVHGEQLDKKKYHFHGSGSSHVFPGASLASMKDVDEYIIKRMAILIAGVGAQKRTDSRDTDTIWKEHAMDDHGKLNQLFFVLRGIRYPGQVSIEDEVKHRNELTLEVGSLVESLLEKNTNLLEEVANYLISQVKNSNQPYNFPCSDIEKVFSRHQL